MNCCESSSSSGKKKKKKEGSYFNASIQVWDKDFWKLTRIHNTCGWERPNSEASGGPFFAEMQDKTPPCSLSPVAGSSKFWEFWFGFLIINTICESIDMHSIFNILGRLPLFFQCFCISSAGGKVHYVTKWLYGFEPSFKINQ